MASVRQKKKGIRAVSSTPPEASNLPRPVLSPNAPHSSAARVRSPAAAPPQPPPRTAVAQSARHKGKRSPTTAVSSSRGSSTSSSPTHLIGGAPGTRCVRVQESCNIIRQQCNSSSTSSEHLLYRRQAYHRYYRASIASHCTFVALCASNITWGHVSVR